MQNASNNIRSPDNHLHLPQLLNPRSGNRHLPPIRNPYNKLQKVRIIRKQHRKIFIQIPKTHEKIRHPRIPKLLRPPKKKNEIKNNEYSHNICKAILTDGIQEPSKQKKTKLLKILCEQTLSNVDTILQDPNMHGMMLWKMYQHILNVKNAYKDGVKRTDLMRIVSQEGTFLADKLFEAVDKCYWSQDYQGICYASEEENESLMQELLYKQLIKQTVLYNKDEFSKKIRMVKNFMGF